WGEDLHQERALREMAPSTHTVRTRHEVPGASPGMTSIGGQVPGMAAWEKQVPGPSSMPVGTGIAAPDPRLDQLEHDRQDPVQNGGGDQHLEDAEIAAADDLRRARQLPDPHHRDQRG